MVFKTLFSYEWRWWLASFMMLFMSLLSVAVTATTLPSYEVATATHASTTYLPEPLCPEAQNHLPMMAKNVVVMQFLRTKPQTANAGYMHDIESGLPEMIRQSLQEHYHTLAPRLHPQGFIHHTATERDRQQQAQRVARQQSAQFVLSGTIDDMSMARPDATYQPSAYRVAANVFHDATRVAAFDRRTRHLALTVELRDGLTGDVLLTYPYRMSGIWNTRRATGFGTIGFFKTPYGKDVRTLTARISHDVARALQCQPFMARIDQPSGTRDVMIQGGSLNGLRAGQQLSVYQQQIHGSTSDYGATHTRLVKRRHRVHLIEVYPSHAVGRIDGQAPLDGLLLAVAD